MLPAWNHRILNGEPNDLPLRPKGPSVYLAQANGLGFGCQLIPEGQRPGSFELFVNGMKLNSTNDLFATEAHKRPGRWPYPECLGVRFPGLWPGLGKRLGLWPEDEIKLLGQSGQTVMPE